MGENDVFEFTKTVRLSHRFVLQTVEYRATDASIFERPVERLFVNDDDRQVQSAHVQFHKLQLVHTHECLAMKVVLLIPKLKIGNQQKKSTFLEIVHWLLIHDAIDSNNGVRRKNERNFRSNVTFCLRNVRVRST